MAEKVASLYAEIGADTKGFDKGAKDVKGGLLGLKQGYSDALKVTAAFSAALVVAEKAYAATVTAAVDYNKSIRELTQVTGTGAEEISRIVQVADDWGISIDQVRTALSMMNKNGMKPSIDNLAALADEYVNTTDKTAFAEKAAKLLGRQYTTLIPLLAKGGQAFRDQAAAIDKGLIATDKSIAAAREYEEALDGWNDRVQAVSMSIGMKLLPSLSKFLDLATGPSADAAAKFLNTVFAGTPLESAAGRQARATTAYGQALEAAALAQTQYYSGVLMVNAAMEQGEPITYDYVYRVTDVDEEASRAAQAVTNFAIGVDKTAESTEKAKGPLDDFLDGVNRDIGSPIAAFIKDLEWFQAGGGKIEAAFAAVQEALAAGKITPEQADMFAKELFVATTDLQLELNQIDAKQAAANLDETLGRQARLIAMKDIKGTEGIEGALASITGIQYYLDFKFRYSGTPPSAYTGSGVDVTVTPTSPPSGPNPRAAGGPVMAGMSYLVGERGPELFTPGQSGGITPNNALGGDVYADITINAAPGMDVNAVAAAVVARLNTARRVQASGGAYRGV